MGSQKTKLSELNSLGKSNRAIQETKDGLRKIILNFHLLSDHEMLFVESCDHPVCETVTGLIDEMKIQEERKIITYDNDEIRKLAPGKVVKRVEYDPDIPENIYIHFNDGFLLCVSAHGGNDPSVEFYLEES